MSTIAFKGRSYSLDDHGFLDPPEQWDEDFAEGMARVLGVRGGLSERHWRLINYLRNKFVLENTVPVLVTACAENQMHLSELRALFPTGYHRGACKIAGINYKFMWDTNYWITYETAPPAKPLYDLGPLGHLADFEQWDEQFADLVLSQRDPPVVPTDRHRQVIRYLRDYYAASRSAPTVYETCHALGLSLEEFHALFPWGYRRGACLMAGLPFFG